MLQSEQYTRKEVMILKYIIILFLLSFPLWAKENKTLESQPQILFEHQNLLSEQEKTELLLKFNTGVLYLEQKRYKEAIALFKQSAKLLKVASYLNIGIAYYKLDAHKNAYLYLKKIYNLKDLVNNDKFSYFSSAFYLYKITNDKDYINEITKIAAKSKRLTEQEQLLVVDTLILQKRYKYALELAQNVPNISNLKLGLLNIKTRDYTKAKIHLTKAYEEEKGNKGKNTVLWFKLFRDLKANDLTNLREDILKIEERLRIFHINKELKLKLFFNKDKFTPKEYFDKITKFSFERKMDFLYYFAPFIFEDYDVIEDQSTRSFIIKSQSDLQDLNMSVKYNRDFLKVIKLDPIRRVQVLQDMITAKYDTNAYEYYNLALAYAQVYDYTSAYKYFKKAYDLEHGNKLYSVMTLLTAKRLNNKINKIEKEFLVKNILSSKGSYGYLGKYMYKIFENPQVALDKTKLSNNQKMSIFFRALYFLDHVNKKGILQTEPLLVEFSKDQLVHMLTLVARKTGESDFNYISRIQDNLPKIYNNMFLKGSLAVTDFYLDTLRALGLFNRTDFNIENELSPSYLRTKALVQLYIDHPKDTIKIIEYIHKKYELKSIESYYILIAAFFASQQENLGFATLGEIGFIYNDQDAKFLEGVSLIQELKLNTAPQYFNYKFKGGLLDFKLEGFDRFLESL